MLFLEEMVAVDLVHLVHREDVRAVRVVARAADELHAAVDLLLGTGKVNVGKPRKQRLHQLGGGADMCGKGGDARLARFGLFVIFDIIARKHGAGLAVRDAVQLGDAVPHRMREARARDGNGHARGGRGGDQLLAHFGGELCGSLREDVPELLGGEECRLLGENGGLGGKVAFQRVGKRVQRGADGGARG